MRPRQLAAALLTLFLLASATAYPATTKKKKTLSLSGTIRAALADTSDSTNPKLAGTLTDKVLGSGAIVLDRVNLGTQAKSRFTAYAKNGSFSGIATSDNIANPDGSLTISNGTITITRGGGIYKHAKGSVTFQGSTDGQQHVTLTYSGKLTYNKK